MPQSTVSKQIHLKHLKTRNAGLIYEILVGHLISEIRANRENNNAISLQIIKKYFRKGTELYKDLQIYNHLSEMLPKKRVNTQLLIKEIVDNDSVDLVKLKDEMYSLCGELRKEYKSLNEFFSVEIPNYKFFGSIYQILEYYRGEYNDSKSVEQRMICEGFVVDNINKKKEIVEVKKPNMGDFSQSVLLEKFIHKYKDSLTKNQFAIVYKYMKGEQKVVDNRVKYILKSLTECVNKLPTETQNKVLQCVKKLNGLGTIDHDEKLKVVVYSQGLLEELKNL